MHALSLYTNRYKHIRPLCPHIFSHSCFFIACLLVSVLKTHVACKQQFTHINTHTVIWMLTVCLCSEMLPCKMKNRINGLQRESVCVFLSLCPSEATFCPFKAVSDWPLSPSLSVSLYLSLLLDFFPLYISSLLLLCLSSPIHPSLFLWLCFSI